VFVYVAREGSLRRTFVRSFGSFGSVAWRRRSRDVGSLGLAAGSKNVSSFGSVAWRRRSRDVGSLGLAAGSKNVNSFGSVAW